MHVHDSENEASVIAIDGFRFNIAHDCSLL